MTMPETTQSDLVERLRDYAPSDGMFIRCHNRSTRQMNADIRKAADEIERLREIESQIDGGRFEEWPTETFVGQLRMQSRDNLDPEFGQFMAATATHMGILSGQFDAQREIAERAKEDAARLRAHCEAMARGLEAAERQISAAFRIVYPGDTALLEGSLENVRQPLSAYRKEGRA
jgi:BMFP domain-containing protein YqiC